MADPLPLALLAWLASAALNASLAALLSRWMTTSRTSLNLLLFGFNFIFLTTGVTMLAGLAGLLHGLTLGLLSALVLAGFLAFSRTRQAIVEAVTELAQTRQGIAALWQSLPRWLRGVTLIAVVGSVLRFGFLIWALPPFVWDSLTYHLTNVAHWVQAGRIELFETPMARIFTPANYEVLAAWFSVFLHHDVVIEAAGLPVYCLGTLAVYVAARELGASRPAAWMGALGYASTPAFLLAATGTKNDPHMAAYYLTALALILHITGAKAEESARGDASAMVGLVLVLLLAAGTKAYIAHLIPGLLVVAVAVGWRSGTLSNWSRAARQSWWQFHKMRGDGRAAIVLVLLLGIFLGGFWNVRNWVLTGNPFYPYGVAVEGNQLLPEGDRTARFTHSRLEENLETLAARYGDRVGPIRPDLPHTTGWGWFAYGLGVPTLLWALVRRRRVLFAALGFSVSFLLLMSSTRPSPWNMRYAIWVPAVFSLSFALWSDELTAVHGWIRGGFWAVLCVCLSLNFVMTLNYNRVPPAVFSSQLSRPVEERHTGVLGMGIPAEYAHPIARLSEDITLGYNLHNNGFIYPLYEADFSRDLTYVPLEPGTPCREIVARMQERGTDYLFVAPEHTPNENLIKLNECEQQEILADVEPGLYTIIAEQGFEADHRDHAMGSSAWIIRSRFGEPSLEEAG